MAQVICMKGIEEFVFLVVFVPGASTPLTLCLPVTGQDTQRHNPCSRRGLSFHGIVYTLKRFCQGVSGRGYLSLKSAGQNAATRLAAPANWRALSLDPEGRCACTSWSFEHRYGGPVPSPPHREALGRQARQLLASKARQVREQVKLRPQLAGIFLITLLARPG